jgi:hypothetical protein
LLPISLPFSTLASSSARSGSTAWGTIERNNGSVLKRGPSQNRSWRRLTTTSPDRPDWPFLRHFHHESIAAQQWQQLMIRTRFIPLSLSTAVVVQHQNPTVGSQAHRNTARFMRSCGLWKDQGQTWRERAVSCRRRLQELEAQVDEKPAERLKFLEYTMKQTTWSMSRHSLCPNRH